MDVAELKQKIASNEPLMILDVREQEELAEGGQIPESVNMPMGQVYTGADKLPKDKKIITVCRSGGRAGVVAEMLTSKGYDAEVLEGGMQAWNADAA